jgi:hypothetical protein
MAISVTCLAPAQSAAALSHGPSQALPQWLRSSPQLFALAREQLWNSLLASSSVQLSNSHELHTLLAVVLKIGNFLNSNRQPLPSVGFRHAIV